LLYVVNQVRFTLAELLNILTTVMTLYDRPIINQHCNFDENADYRMAFLYR
jgi:hypothetical protein